MEMPPWYVLTGGPCSGKTTLVNGLKAQGYSVLPESVRTIISAGLAQGKSIDEIVADPLALQHTIIEHQLELQSQTSKSDVTFLDRAVPDNIAYYRKFGLPLDAAIREGVDAVKYRKVFLLDMIEFVNDAERYESPEEAAELHAAIRRAYQELGYEITEVPILPVSERADFILKRL
ncbi:MAG TPA: ATP-binding protein [Candidatus Paceibacterota bacterium]|jgi:predicted ATPase|nr:ATP-binding protein [Candidatus Paceibacterota bacterium]